MASAMEKAELFVGSEVVTSKGSIHKITKVLGKNNNGNIIFEYTCSICSNDKELFPDGLKPIIKSSFGKTISCNCSENPMLTKEQTIIKVKRKLKMFNFDFISLDGEYIGQKTKINCKCNECSNTFKKSINHILNNNNGCKNCFSKSRYVENPEERVVKSLSIKGQKFVRIIGGYTGRKSDVEYECPHHGIKKSTFDIIVNGHGCNECGYEEMKDKQKTKNPKDVITECLNKNMYTFIKFPNGFENVNSMVEYECPHHGIKQAAFGNIKYGTMCNECRGGGFKNTEPGVFYIVKWTNTNGVAWYKFGITGLQVPEDRMKRQVYEHNRHMKEELIYEIRYMCKWDDGYVVVELEKEFESIQNRYGQFCTKQMMWDGSTETISLDSVEDLQEAIKDITWASL